MNICLLPLDSRPCNYVFIRELAEAARVNISVPPKKIMDYFTEPSKTEDLKAWLEKNGAFADCIILSVDQFLYGGLLASRRQGKTQEQIEDDFLWLEHFKAKHPRIKILAFSVLMRTTIGTLREENKIWWEAVAEYSKKKYAELTFQRKEDIEAVKNLEKRIPFDVLNEFLCVRQRNHNVNCRCIFLTKTVFDKLIIVQEDCCAESLHIPEKQILMRMVCDEHLESKVFFHNGADEAGMELTSCAVAENKIKTTDVQLCFLFDNRNFTAKYEDIPFYENLKDHLRLLNIREVKNCEKILCILPPKTRQGDYCPVREDSGSYRRDDYEVMADIVCKHIRAKKKVFLLDLAYANGGDFSFMSILMQKCRWSTLYGYAAWNTAGNALGTVLTQIILSDGVNGRVNRRFTAERLLDDLFYQAIVREKVSKKLQCAGQDVWALKNIKEAAILLKQTVREEKEVLKSIFGKKIPDFKISFPWPRTFEVEILVNTESKKR